jgi:ankyrin repeat protein
MAVIDLPLSWGVDPNVRNNNGATALTTAVWHDSADLVRAFLERGVDPCLADNLSDGRTPLEMAQVYGVSDAVTAELEAVTQCSDPDSL